MLGMFKESIVINIPTVIIQTLSTVVLIAFVIILARVIKNIYSKKV
jgi:hypothetical protein